MIKIYLSLILLCLLNVVHAQTNTKSIIVSGKILSADGFPANGVLVALKKSNHIAYTNANGVFNIESNLGTQQLIINSGLSATTREINVEKNKVDLGTIKLTEKAIDLKEVVVTAQYGVQSIKNAVYTVKVINAERIRLSAATNVQQVLNTELGFRFSNDLTLGVADVELMGMSGRNIKILLDGVPMVDRADTRESLNQIDINTIERIEIVEGPVAVVYGTDALAGVINIITKGAGTALINVTAKLQEETAGQEYAGLTGAGVHQQNLGVSWQHKGWSALIGASHMEFGGWNLAPKTATIAEVNASTNRWKPKEQWLANSKIGYRTEKLNIWYRLDAVNEDILSRGGINPNNFKGELQSYLTHRYSHQLQSAYRFSNQFQFNAVVGYTNLKRSTVTKIHDYSSNSTILSGEAGKQDIAKFNATIFRLTAHYNPNKKIAFQPGFEFNRDVATGQRIKGEPVINDFAFFLSSEYKPNAHINIRPGLRFTKNTVYEAPTLIPSLNTKFSLASNIDLRLSYAKGFRAPALRELYYDFFDASHAIMGNEDLKAEESNSYNASLVWRGKQDEQLQLSTTLTGFYNRFKNRIDYGMDPNNSTITTLINIAKYQTRGATIAQTLKYKKFQANIGFSYIGRYNNLLVSNQNLDVPIIMWAPELNGNFTYQLSKLKSSVSLFYKYTGARPGYQLNMINGVQSTKLVKVGAFSWADLMLNKTICGALNINAGIKNLFDIKQLSNSASASEGAHSSGVGSVPYSYGRSYVLGISYNWTKN